MPSAFVPGPGQVDFSAARWAPVINCVVKHDDKILLVKRRQQLNFYPGYWNGISGFLDDARSLEDKVRDELREELGISPDQIVSLRRGAIFNQDEPKYNKTWIVHPVLVEVNTNRVQLDWEAEEYRWVSQDDVKTMKLLPGFEQVLKNLPIG